MLFSPLSSSSVQVRYQYLKVVRSKVKFDADMAIRTGVNRSNDLGFYVLYIPRGTKIVTFTDKVARGHRRNRRYTCRVECGNAGGSVRMCPWQKFYCTPFLPKSPNERKFPKKDLIEIGSHEKAGCTLQQAVNVTTFSLSIATMPTQIGKKADR